MKVDDLKLSENAILAADLLRKLVEQIEKPDMIYDGSVEELVKLLDIAAHSSSRDIVQCAQQFLGFTDTAQLMFFKSVGVHLENIFAAKALLDTPTEKDRDTFSDSYSNATARYKWM